MRRRLVLAFFALLAGAHPAGAQTGCLRTASERSLAGGETVPTLAVACDPGVDPRLGHVKLETTQIYTQVSIRQLKEIHTATHPSAKLEARRARATAAKARDAEELGQ